MAKVAKNVIVEGMSGTIGSLVFRQMKDGSTWVSGMPDFSRRKFSQGQKNHQSRFQVAAAYARRAAKTHPIYAELAEGTTKSAYNMALSDWFHPPVVHQIERKAGKIRVQASDNVMVTKVQVTILDDQGNVLETGEAKQESLDANPGWWEYAARGQGQVVAEAWDLAATITRLAL
jgi:hypothetical protein